MESLLNRYRSITVLLLVIFAQLVLLAVQVKNDQNVSVIRSWTVTAVSPAARILEWGRHSSVGFVRNYVLLRDAGEENRNLQSEVGRLKVENVFLKNELNLADRAKALQSFGRARPSKTLAATVFMSAAGSDSNAVFVDRGSLSGVERGMGVVTPDGIVGKVLRVNAMSSMVGLISDQDFAAGVTTQGGQVRGHPQGTGKAHVQGGLRPVRGQDRPRRPAVHLRRRPHLSARVSRRSRKIREQQQRAVVQRTFWPSPADCATAFPRTCSSSSRESIRRSPKRPRQTSRCTSIPRRRPLHSRKRMPRRGRSVRKPIVRKPRPKPSATRRATCSEAPTAKSPIST